MHGVYVGCLGSTHQHDLPAREAEGGVGGVVGGIGMGEWVGWASTTHHLNITPNPCNHQAHPLCTSGASVA